MGLTVEHDEEQTVDFGLGRFGEPLVGFGRSVNGQVAQVDLNPEFLLGGLDLCGVIAERFFAVVDGAGPEHAVIAFATDERGGDFGDVLGAGADRDDAAFDGGDGVSQKGRGEAGGTEREKEVATGPLGEAAVFG